MTPEQREKLKQAADRIIDDGWYEERDKGMALDACASDYDFIFKANPAAILSLIAQVEALTVPNVSANVSAMSMQPLCNSSGWKCVPVELTNDMLVAFAEVWYSKARAIDDYEMQDCYAAMLDAAPTIPTIPGTKEGE